jgi:drug/metabolite transporter (DMT)-like permease
VWNDLPLFYENVRVGQLLGFTAITTFAYAILLSASFRRGKLSIVEPILSLELPITIAISILFIGEHVVPLQFALIGIIFIGLIATVVRHEPRHWWNLLFKHRMIERGVVLAVFAACVSAPTNILTGVLSQASTPVLTIWGIHTSLAIFCFIWMALRNEVVSSFKLAKKNWRPVLAEGILDNLAWISYAVAVTLIPISITIAITESYIALAALLGILINKERLQRHQYVGIAISIIAAIILAVVSEVG